MKNIFKLLIALLLLVFYAGCDKDKFAELNSNPSTLSKPEIRFLVAEAIKGMYSDDYTIWYYNKFDYIFPWSQLTSDGNGNGHRFVEMGNTGGQNIYRTIFPNTIDIRDRISLMEDDKKNSMKAIRAMTFSIQIQPAITITDKTGSLVYTEAGLAPYTDPPLFAPKIDNQELLFNTWIEELDAAIIDLSATNQFNIGNQDIIYGGDYSKWAKFCNLLKLKIAARLVNKDRAKALKIAEEVANSSVGFMNDLSDDFIYGRGFKYSGTGNGTGPGAGAKNIIDFMVKNKDPRVRVLFTKNHFNAEVVQAFIDADKELPPYIKQHVILNDSGNFDSWSAPGEPWVRYYGSPISPDASLDAVNDPYFKQQKRNKITLNGKTKTYLSISAYNERITRTGVGFRYPTKPGGIIKDLSISQNPPLDVILGSSAETNLYLAEFKLLGANLPETAQTYFERGVTLSVKRMDLIARNHVFPYYDNDPIYEDDIESEIGATKLKTGEIDELLTQSAYNLTTDGLEKVYIQQYINFAATPGDMWTLTRRSGIPKTGSSIFPREEFLVSGGTLTVPRRFVVGNPLKEDLMYENTKAAIQEQNFTTGTNSPSILNTERIWFDKENPKYGAGPKN